MTALQNKTTLIIFIAIVIYGLIWYLVPTAQVASWFRLDKVGHFWGFFCLTLITHKLTRLPVYSLTLGLVFYSGATEVGQNYLGFRNGTLEDFYADALGVVSYSTLYYLLSKFLPKETQSE